jgi:hypothetical protein
MATSLPIFVSPDFHREEQENLFARAYAAPWDALIGHTPMRVAAE